jgi:hypothetical protein
MARKSRLTLQGCRAHSHCNVSVTRVIFKSLFSPQPCDLDITTQLDTWKQVQRGSVRSHGRAEVDLAFSHVGSNPEPDWVAITKYHRLGGLNNRDLIEKSKIKVPSNLVPFGGPDPLAL